MKININSSIKKARYLYNHSKYKESKEILVSLLGENIDKKQSFMIFTFLGANFQELKEYEKAISFFKKALKIYEKAEVVSLGIYLCYVCLEEYDLAFEEIFRFLKSHKAEIYKDTLEELLTDVKSGSINDEDTIKTIQYYAKENDVKIDG